MEDHELLRAWRRTLKLTQEEFGDKVDRTSRTIANWESGDYDIPNEKIARKLGFTYEEYKKGPSEYKQRSIETVEQMKYISDSKQHALIPETMIPVYCLPEINKSFLNSPFEGFMHPTIILPNTVDFCRIIVDKPVSASKITNRIIVNKKPADDEDYFLIWDGKQSDIVHKRKLTPEMKILGSVLL
jgi:DNA-binding XRE family transcriptional regulator